MEIKIILQQEYSHYPSGKTLLVRESKYKSMMMEGVKLRVLSPNPIPALTGYPDTTRCTGESCDTPCATCVETAMDDRAVETAEKPKPKKKANKK